MTLLFLLPTAITATAVASAGVAPAPPGAQVVIADGHVDLGPRFVHGRWTIQLRDDTGDPVVWRPLENVVVQATDKAELSVPADPAYSFLGKAGQKVWVIPQVQQPGVVWPGWNTQDPEVAKRVDREVTWSLNGVDGPGTFTLFLNSDFGKPAPVFDSRKPFPQETGIDVNTHVHGNWTFSAPGTYLLDITMRAELTDGTTVTDHRPLRLYAGPGNPLDAFKTTAPVGPAPREEAGDGGGLDLVVVGIVVFVAVSIGVVLVLRRRKRVAA
ncbi:TIGR03773 family transporter-associated surface protein [Kribbella sp. NPDC051620]|uniref:TIGR03773 family transporter-associated surface protein n=1 Tax=Kribbella sp. NPDC051620 TaxID=3364120 RepID=UPI0037A658E8